jgi:hypothetical protein
MSHPIMRRLARDMKRTILSFATAAILAVRPHAHAVLGVGDIVSDPIAEEALIQKNIFDQIKYAWEQTQWADKLATLHNTLTTVREHLQTANQIKQAIGDPVAAIALIDNGLFSDFLQDSGITDTLSDLVGIAQEGVALSATIQELFQPIEMSAWSDVSNWTLAPFEGIASFRDSDDPLKRFRALENAYSRLEILIGQAQNRRRTLNLQIARLNGQLKTASDDAEVQKLVGSLATAQTALDDIDYVSDSAHRQVEMLHVLNQNRQAEEEVAAEEISRRRNRELARLAAEAEAALPDFNEPNPDLPSGF